jgi:hypothetical protein
MYNYTIYYDGHEILINTPYELKKGYYVYIYIPQKKESRRVKITEVQYEFFNNGVFERVALFTEDL